jgi:hypothetical protein
MSDLAEAGIIDRTKVARIGLENAVSVASVLLLTEATMTESPKREGTCARAGDGYVTEFQAVIGSLAARCEQDAVVDFLSRPASYGTTSHVERIDTHLFDRLPRPPSRIQAQA